jgi:hypothetical protein
MASASIFSRPSRCRRPILVLLVVSLTGFTASNVRGASTKPPTFFVHFTGAEILHEDLDNGSLVIDVIDGKAFHNSHAAFIMYKKALGSSSTRKGCKEVARHPELLFCELVKGEQLSIITPQSPTAASIDPEVLRDTIDIVKVIGGSPKLDPKERLTRVTASKGRLSVMSHSTSCWSYTSSYCVRPAEVLSLAATLKPSTQVRINSSTQGDVVLDFPTKNECRDLRDEEYPMCVEAWLVNIRKGTEPDLADGTPHHVEREDPDFEIFGKIVGKTLTIPTTADTCTSPGCSNAPKPPSPAGSNCPPIRTKP